MEPFQKLGIFLKEARVELGLSQKDIAEKVGIHTQYVSNYERGLCAPPSHSFGAILKLLKVKKEDVVDVMLEDSRREIEARVYKNRKSA